MKYLARRIQTSRWETLVENDIPADALLCLNTKQNTLSVWECDDLSELNNIAIASSAGPGSKTLTGFSLAVFETQALEDQNFNLEIFPGITTYTDLIDNHKNLSSLNLTKINYLATYISKSYFEWNALSPADKKSYPRLQYYPPTLLRKLVVEAISNDLIDPRMLQDHYRQDLHI